MYLTLTLPRALDKQVEVVVVRVGQTPVSHCFTLSRHDKVEQLRSAVSGKTGLEPDNIVLAEVLHHRIRRQLENHMQLRYVNVTNRTVYALEVITVADRLAAVDTTDEMESGVHNNNNPVAVECDVVVDGGGDASPLARAEAGR